MQMEVSKRSEKNLLPEVQLPLVKIICFTFETILVSPISRMSVKLVTL